MAARARRAAGREWVVITGQHPYDETRNEPSDETTTASPEPVSKPQIIICERSGIWATVLGRHLPRDVQVLQTRGLDECASALAAAPAALVALELTHGNLAGVLDLLGELPARFPLARVIVLGEHELRACEPLVREAGAVGFFASPRDLAGLRQTAQNHFAQLPARQADFAESVWAALPWSDATTA